MARSKPTDVVVVGAGTIGLAVAVELRRAGVERVTVVDRAPAAGMGATGRANGGVRAQFATKTNIRFSQHTIRALIELDAATAGRAGYKPIGYLFMAGTDSSDAALRRAVAVQRSLGVAVDWMTAAEVAEIAPVVSLDGLRSAAFCASDGVIDPHGVTAALCEEGRRAGVSYVFDCEVTGLEPSRRGAHVRCRDRTHRGGVRDQRRRSACPRGGGDGRNRPACRSPAAQPRLYRAVSRAAVTDTDVRRHGHGRARPP